MKNWSKSLSFLFISILIVFVSQVAASDKKEAVKNLTITDSAGKRFEFSSPIKRIAVHYPYILEVIEAIGAGDRVVAVPDNVRMFGKLFEKYTETPKIGQGAGPGSKLNIEVLLKTEPDVLLVHPGTSQQLGLEERLKQFNIPVVAIDITSLDTLQKNIQILAKLLNKEKEGLQLTQYISSKLNIIDEKVKNMPLKNKVRVYPEFFTDFYICIKGFTGDPIVTRAGGINIGSELTANIVSSEWVIKQNPDVIIKAQLPYLIPSGLDVKDYQGMERLRQQIMSRPGWGTIKAVKEGKVYVINSDLWTGPRVWLGTIYTAKALYPDRFRDIDPDKIHKEYLINFMNIKDDGIWFWPKP